MTYDMEEMVRKLDRLRDRVDELEDHAHCDNCGSVIDSDSEFCSDECLAEFDGEAPQQPTGPPPSQPQGINPGF